MHHKLRKRPRGKFFLVFCVVWCSIILIFSPINPNETAPQNVVRFINYLERKEMHTDTFIVGRNVILRPPRESDAEHVVEWINDPKIRRYLMRRMPVSLLAEKDWIAKSSKLEPFPESIMLMIEMEYCII